MNLNDPGLEDSLPELLSEARSGSLPAQNELLERYRPYLQRVASNERPVDLQAKLGASDVVQNAMLVIVSHLPEFVGDSEVQLRAWMRRVLLNQLANETRQYRAAKRDAGREEALDEALAQPDEPSPESWLVECEEQQRVVEALSRLPQRYRAAVELRHRSDLTFAEIGQRLECSEEAARKLWARGVVALQRELGLDE